jgi:hypothetical protein
MVSVEANSNRRWKPALLVWSAVLTFVVFAGINAIVLYSLHQTNKELLGAIAGLPKDHFPGDAGAALQSESQIRCSQIEEVSTSLDALRLEVRKLGEDVASMEIQIGSQSMPPSIVPNEKTMSNRIRTPTLPKPWLDEEGTGGLSSVTPETLREWRGSSSLSSRQQIEEVLRRHSLETRERIALETDPLHPDHEVVGRIMREGRAELEAELRDVMSPKEYETLFGVAPAQEVGPGASTRSPY